MQDFGLRDACNGHKVVLLDTSALHLRELGLFGKKETDAPLLRSGRDHIKYLDSVNELFRSALLITPGVSNELGRFEELTKKLEIPRSQKNLIKQVCDFARNNRVITYTEEEQRMVNDASLYFKFFSRFISAADYEILISSIATGTYRGSSGVLTNDTGMMYTFDAMVKFLRKGYVNHGMPRVACPIKIYSMMTEGEFSVQSCYDPNTCRTR